MKKLIIIALSLSIILGFLFWKFGPQLNQKPKGPITLTYWGILDEENIIKPIIEAYQKQNPNVAVNYVKQSPTNYRLRVEAQIKDGSGPDIFRIHNSWLSMFLKDGSLAPAPVSVFSLSDYKGMFYPVAFDSFVSNGQIYAAPYEIDGLSLFYNEDMLSAIGGVPPTSWEDFITLSNKMTVKDQNGIKTAGAAMGATNNIDYFGDILGLLLIQQPGVDFNNLTNPAAVEVFKFYSSFLTDPRKKSWDGSLPNSTQMFEEGRLGFYFAPSSKVSEIKLASPALHFKVVPPPQLPGRAVGWASFWGEAVSAKSANSEEAWKFVKYLTSADIQKYMYQQANQNQLLVKPYSLVNLSSEISSDPTFGAFVNQGPFYKFWYLASNTQDNGVNDEMIKIFGDGINSVLAGTDPQIALQTVNSGVKGVLDKYVNPAPAK